MDFELSWPELERRAALHAALGDPIRLAIADEVALSDRSPAELATRFGISSSLLTHHVDLLIEAGFLVRTASHGDRRRRYVQFVPGALDHLIPHRMLRARRLVFVCTANSARSQFAQALWHSRRPDIPAVSGGTEPAEKVHPQAVTAARRVGLSLDEAAPRSVPTLDPDDLVVTVCDRAHEGMTERSLPAVPLRNAFLHWAIPDPVDDGDFDNALASVRRRVDTLAHHVSDEPSHRQAS